MILFCLPYAGGSESIYYKWKKYLKKNIELCPLELNGRGKRYEEDFYENLEEAVEDIFINIKDKICKSEYAIYGHSMGSLLAYELYYKIDKMKLPKPKHIFFSGYSAPSSIKTRENTYMLPNYDFMKKIMELAGTPEELLNNEELLQIFLPIIRNDFKILEQYHYKKRKNKISCNVSIFNGKQDSMKLNQILDWKNHVSEDLKIYNFQGNHFFINNNIESITKIINDELINKDNLKRTVCNE